jgi:hypothetical protein
MLFKSALVTQASGSVGGVTAAHNAGGLYLRARSIPVNPNTPAQQAARNAMAQLTTRWQQTLTAAQRTAWSTYAANVPLVNSLGDARLVSGMNMYVRSNAPRVVAGADVVDAGPTTYSLATFTPVTATGSEGGADIDVEYTDTDDWAIAEGGHLIVQASAQISPTINFFKGPFVFAATADGAAVAPASPLNIPRSPADTEGNKVYIRVRASNPDGRLSASQIVAITIAA